MAFPPSTPKDKRWVAVAQLYNAFLDESGTHEASEAVIVAGFVSNEAEWIALSVAWQNALDDWQIDHFHMTDFESYQGQFASWTKEEHKNRLNYLLDLINKHTFSSIAFAVLKKSFDEILSEKAKAICGDAYGLASIGCWNSLALRAKQPSIDGYLDYVMEKGAKGSSVLAWLYGIQSQDAEWVNDTRILSLDFRDKRVLPPLQAADILAYEVYKHMQRQFGGLDLPTRYPLKRLNTIGKQWHYANNDELRVVDKYLTEMWDKSALST